MESDQERDMDAETERSQNGAGGNGTRMSYSQIMGQKLSSVLREALQLHQEGDASRAVAKLTRAIALDPKHPELFKQRAEAHLTLRNFHSAIINFKKALLLQPSEHLELTERLATVHCVYGKHLQEEGKYEKALEMFERASEYRQEDKEIITKRMECLLSLQRYDECLAMINHELVTDESNPTLYVLRAQINILFGNTALGYYDVCSALQIDPLHKDASEIKKKLQKDALACKNQAVHHSLVGRKMEALKKITAAIETDPAVPEYHTFRGAVHRSMRDFNAAMDDFLAAMDKCGHQQDCEVYRDASRQLVLTYNDFAVECYRRRRFSEAVTLLNKAVKEEKREKGLYLNRGDCFYRMNNLHFALPDYQQALELDQSDWSIRCRIAVVFCELGVECFGRGQYSEAEEHFSSAIQHNPKVSRFYFCRARARHEREDVAGAQEDLLASLILDPSNEECLSLIARVFPGKSKTSLLQSSDVALLESRLKSAILGSCPKEETSAKENNSPYGIDLKIADAANERDIPTREGQPSWSTVQSPWHQMSNSSSTTTDQEESPGCPAPRPYAILDQPLPHGHEGAEGVLPPLRNFLQESNFHSQIYYSKKSCTEEVERVLRSSIDFGPPPPRIQATHEIMFGSRQVTSKKRTVNSHDIL